MVVQKGHSRNYFKIYNKGLCPNPNPTATGHQNGFRGKNFLKHLKR